MSLQQSPLTVWSSTLGIHMDTDTLQLQSPRRQSETHTSRYIQNSPHIWTSHRVCRYTGHTHSHIYSVHTHTHTTEIHRHILPPLEFQETVTSKHTQAQSHICTNIHIQRCTLSLKSQETVIDIQTPTQPQRHTYTHKDHSTSIQDRMCQNTHEHTHAQAPTRHTYRIQQ